MKWSASALSDRYSGTAVTCLTATVDLRSMEWAWIECDRSPTETAEMPRIARLRESGAGPVARWHHDERSCRHDAVRTARKRPAESRSHPRNSTTDRSHLSADSAHELALRRPSGPWGGKLFAPPCGPQVSVAMAGGASLLLTIRQSHQPSVPMRGVDGLRRPVPNGVGAHRTPDQRSSPVNRTWSKAAGAGQGQAWTRAAIAMRARGVPTRKGGSREQPAGCPITPPICMDVMAMCRL